MANHLGGDILNDVLRLLDARGFFREQQKSGTRTFLQEVLRIAQEADCSPGDVIEGIGPRLGICPHCQRPSFNPSVGDCTKCEFAGNASIPAWASEH
jgi:hypothetical protein